MPEGHSIHRIARRFNADLGGRAVTASSPQGRFSDGAALISGSELGVNSTQAIFLGAIFVVALPLVVLVTGIAIWLRRRHR